MQDLTSATDRGRRKESSPDKEEHCARGVIEAIIEERKTELILSPSRVKPWVYK